MFAKYRKAVGVVVVTVLTFLITILTDGITPQEWVLLAGEGVSAVGVAIVPNLDQGIAAVAKTWVAGILGGLTVLAVVILGGLTTAELAEVLIGAAAAVGVTGLPNSWPPSRLPVVSRGETRDDPMVPPAG